MATVGKRGKRIPPTAYVQYRREVIQYASLIVKAIEREQWDDVITFAGQMVGPALWLLMYEQEEQNGANL